MENIYNQKVINANNLLGDDFIETRHLFLYCFNRLPSINYINQIDGEKAFELFRQQFDDLIQHIHQYRWFKRQKKDYQFAETVVILNNRCIVEFDHNYCEIMHDGRHPQFVEQVTKIVNQFKARALSNPWKLTW